MIPGDRHREAKQLSLLGLRGWPLAKIIVCKCRNIFVQENSGIKFLASVGVAHLKYLVLNDRGRWNINCQGQTLGTYQSEQQAISKAIEAAFSNSMRGHKVEVLTQGLLGELKVVCTYGRDRQQARQ